MVDSKLVDQTSARFLDSYFGRWLAESFPSGKQAAEIEKLATAVSYATSLKHSCLDIAQAKNLHDPVLHKLLSRLDAEKVKQLCKDDIASPLVRSADGKRLWLQKYFVFERSVAAAIQQRSQADGAITAEQKNLLDKLFSIESNEQRQAAEKALTHRLSIITGGPGTGKTWTVARLIVLLRKANPAIRIQLAAPTGKAGARMKVSLDYAFTHDTVLRELDANLTQISEKPKTIDGLLGINSRISPHARRHAQNPINCDVLIVDESSMIALPMMYRLLNALPDKCRLILLGDKDQLASVEAGSVLADICSTTNPEVQRCITMITKSHRFIADSEIGILARNLNQGSATLAPSRNSVQLHIYTKSGSPEIADWLELATQHWHGFLKTIEEKKHDQAGILAALTEFQVLCALREGPFGISGINELVAKKLGKDADSWYAGKPVIITQNDHARHLYNGDVGIILPCMETSTCAMNLKACFLVDGKVKQVSRNQMPPHETCYAMTVHKSQGSEYNQVCIVLPDNVTELSPVVSRELVYTAVTRARQKVDIWCGSGVLAKAASQKVERMSGLLSLLDYPICSE